MSGNRRRSDLAPDDGLTVNWWRCRAELLDSEGMDRGREYRDGLRMERETQALRRFLAGPPGDADFDRVIWEESRRREEHVWRDDKRVGSAIVYEAPLAGGAQDHTRSATE